MPVRGGGHENKAETRLRLGILLANEKSSHATARLINRAEIVPMSVHTGGWSQESEKKIVFF